MTILILPFTWLHSTPKPTCWASPVEARPGQGPGWTVYRVESAGCKIVLPWSVRTPWVPPTYQSHIYDNCDECEELLCFSLQLSWHKIFHYKLIATILWLCWATLLSRMHKMFFNTGPNYFAINSQFLKLFIWCMFRTPSRLYFYVSKAQHISNLNSFVKLVWTFCLFYYPCIIFCPYNGSQWQKYLVLSIFCVITAQKPEWIFLCWKSAKTRLSR